MKEAKKQVAEGEKVVIGVDLHPDSFTAVALQGTALNHRQLWLDDTVTAADYPRWLKRRVTSNCVVIFEASGNSFEYAGKAEKAGAQALVIDSRKLGQIRKVYCENDKIAARKIAKCYLSGMADDSEVWPPDEATKTRREIISTYNQAVKNATRGKNRLRGYLSDHAVRLPKKFRLTAPDALKKILDMYGWNTAQQQLIKVKMEEMLHAENVRREMVTTIINEVKNDPSMCTLIKLCGIRAITAFALVASIGDINRFESPKKLASYIGLIPCCHQSGKSEVRWGMTKYGVKQLKSIMIQAAQSIYRSKNQSGESLRQWGVRMAFRKGKPSAIAAMARKLAVAVWYQLKGFMPAVMEKPQVISTKLRHLIADMLPEFFKNMGYKSKEDFYQEFCLVMDLRT